MANQFPTILNAFTRITCGSTTTPKDAINEIYDTLEAHEAKIGIDSSAVVTSIDYLLTNTSSSNPGHKHTLADGATDVTSTATELNYLDGVSLGTAVASLAVVLDSNKDFNFGTGDITATDITGTNVNASTSLSLPNAVPTVDGDIGFDQTNEDLAVGDGSAGQIVHMGAYKSYSPAWTGTGSDPVIGNGTLSGAYSQVGKLIVGYVKIIAGSTTTFGSGGYRVSLPLASNYVTNQNLGSVTFLDSGTAYEGGMSRQVSSTTIEVVVATGGAWNPSTPFTFAVNDVMTFNFTYETSA